MKKITALKIILIIILFTFLLLIDFVNLKKKIKFFLKQFINFIYKYNQLNRKKEN